MSVLSVLSVCFCGQLIVRLGLALGGGGSPFGREAGEVGADGGSVPVDVYILKSVYTALARS